MTDTETLFISQHASAPVDCKQVIRAHKLSYWFLGVRTFQFCSSVKPEVFRWMEDKTTSCAGVYRPGSCSPCRSPPAAVWHISCPDPQVESDRPDPAAWTWAQRWKTSRSQFLPLESSRTLETYTENRMKGLVHTKCEVTGYYETETTIKLKGLFTVTM